MPVRFDKSRQRDHGVGGNDFCFGRGQITPDGDNDPLARVDVAPVDFTEIRVHRQNMGILHNELAPCGKRAR
jgi:hypothetical protein